MPKALVVLSGGQDSTTCLAWALRKGWDVAAITFNYNQRHSREIIAAMQVAKLMGVTDHEVLHIGPILNGTSPLTNPKENLELYSDYKTMDEVIGDRVEKTFVPMRNALFLTLAANRAACIGATAIITGVCQADNANYPDCRATFIEAQERTINEALGYGPVNPDYIEIITPLMNLSKAKSIAYIQTLGHLALLAFTHTAYDGQYPPVGKDHASTLRAQGFVEANCPDPLVLRAFFEGSMPLPETENYSNPTLNAKLCAQIDELQRRLQA